MSEAHILVATQPGVAVVRVIGRATFKVSRDLRDFATTQIANGVRSIVVDLSECVTMDSTFMGVLALVGIQGRDRLHLVLVNAGGNNRELLDGIGVSRVWTYADEPAPDADWTTLCKAAAGVADNLGELAPTMLEAHQVLMDLDPANVPKFRDVVELLGGEVNTDGQ